MNVSLVNLHHTNAWPRSLFNWVTVVSTAKQAVAQPIGIMLLQSLKKNWYRYAISFEKILLCFTLYGNFLYHRLYDRNHSVALCVSGVLLKCLFSLSKSADYLPKDRNYECFSMVKYSAFGVMNFGHSPLWVLSAGFIDGHHTPLFIVTDRHFRV